MATDYREITRWGRLPAWWMFHPDMNADRLCLLAALTTYADERGLCCPSQSTLAKLLKRSRPWVNRVIAELVDIGLVEKRSRARANGGTTSCEYLLRFSVEDTPVTSATAPGNQRDTPRHPADTNQVTPEHKHPPRAEARAGFSQKSLVDEAVARPRADLDLSGSEDPQQSKVPEETSDHHPSSSLPERGWQPSSEARLEASRLFPDADLDTHVALFVSRVRGKGYCIEPGRLDDTWLSWFIEDHRAGREQRQAKAGSPALSAPNTYNRMHRYDRFSAWAEAALS